MTIFNKIGNFFTTNYKNGKIEQFVGAIGKLGISAGFLSYALSNKSSCDSIFGNMYSGGCCNHAGVYPMVNTYSTMGSSYFSPLSDPYLQHLMQCDPMGILNSPYAQIYGDGTYSSTYMPTYNNPALMMQQFMPTYLESEQETGLEKTDAKYAGDLDKNQDSTVGEQLDKGLASLQKDGKAVKNSSLKMIEFGNDKSKYEQEYKTQVSEIAKSWLADVDKNGTKDGKVTFEEYAKYELKSLPENMSKSQQETALELTKNSFNKLDQNGDGKLDWKETAAMIRTFDRNKDNLTTVDGKIQSEDFEQWSGLMGEGKSNVFDQSIRSDYKKLFGNE